MHSRLIYGGHLTDPFDITNEVRQRCLLSPFLFFIAVDQITRQTNTNKGNGIYWIQVEQLYDLGLSDDIGLCLTNTNR